MLWKNIKWKAIELYVFKLQKKIYQASKKNCKLEMFRLQKILITSQAAKLKAVRKVTQDNRDKKFPERNDVGLISSKKRFEFASLLVLKNKVPSIKKVYRSKNNAETSLLKASTLLDKAKQLLVLMVLEPQWEAQFEPNSYGFRPGRSSHDAVEAIFIAINQKSKFILGASIQGSFNEINYNVLLSKLETFPRMENQIKAWLKAGALGCGFRNSIGEETPQGSLFSVLLVNLIFHGLENAVVHFMKNLKIKDRNGKYIVKRRRSSSINIIRYGGNFVILHENELVIKECKKFVQNFLSVLGLKLNESKTQTRHTLDWFEKKSPGLDFLGFHIRQYRIGKYAMRKTKASLPYRTLIFPSKSKIKEHYKYIKEIINNTRKTEVLLMKLNPKIIRWARYYSTVVSYKTFKWLNTLLFKALLKWQYKKHSNRSRKWLNNIYYHTEKNRSWVFGVRTKKNNELISLKQYTDIAIQRFVKVRGNKSPYDGDTLYWSSRLKNHPTRSSNVSKLLGKQKGRCNVCKLPFFPTDIIEQDHITPVSQGGDNKSKNFQLLHGHCHQKKTAIDSKLM